MNHSKSSSTPLPVSSSITQWLPGDYLFPLRLVLGWTYFSAFWRRLILENKLDPEGAGYIGEKFNHFLPNAFLIRPVIEFFVSNPELLLWKLWVFTIVEGIVGLLLMLGLMTRWMGLATSMLAFGILLGAGWLGTTCLDEWQIGVLGVSGGLVFAFAGGGRLSLDHRLISKYNCGGEKRRPWINRLFGSGMALPKSWVIIPGLAMLGLTLLTNQVFHNGVWGKLHNKSVKPIVEVSDARISGENLRFTAFRVEGADVYGAFLISVRLVDPATENAVVNWTATDLVKLSAESIQNSYVAKIKPGVNSLILPLGAKAEIQLKNKSLQTLPKQDYTLELEDISGAVWTAPVTFPTNP
ncbi:MAG: TQO small subunit DoxD [Verrucomicrobiales bacterium]|nr:TQO small subunit DoxD [Verrucomicrobiales bacterium]